MGGVDSFVVGGVDSFVVGGVDSFVVGDVDSFVVGGVDSFVVGGVDSFVVGGVDSFVVGVEFFPPLSFLGCGVSICAVGWGAPPSSAKDKPGAMLMSTIKSASRQIPVRLIWFMVSPPPCC